MEEKGKEIVCGTNLLCPSLPLPYRFPPVYARPVNAAYALNGWVGMPEKD